jgi:hypothetical protein
MGKWRLLGSFRLGQPGALGRDAPCCSLLPMW